MRMVVVMAAIAEAVEVVEVGTKQCVIYSREDKPKKRRKGIQKPLSVDRPIL